MTNNHFDFHDVRIVILTFSERNVIWNVPWVIAKEICIGILTRMVLISRLSLFRYKPILIYNVDKTKSRVGFAGRTLPRDSPSFQHICVPITSCLLFIRYMFDSDMITIITKARSGRSRVHWTIALDIKCIGIPITTCCYLLDFLVFFERTARSIPAGNDDEER